MTQPTYGLIGRGRVATHMAHYLRLEEQSCTVWHRGLGHSPDHSLGECSTILLAISDDSLEPFVEEQHWLLGRTTVHFSGSRALPSIAGLHPAMTFGPDLYDLQTYRAIPFIEETGSLKFAEVFPGLQNSSWPIDPEAKSLYHALCVLGGNGTAGLASAVLNQFEKRLGLPRRVLKPLLEQSLANIVTGDSRSLTGPWVRQDTGTIARNLEALKGSPLEEIYRACHRAVRTDEEQ